MVPESSALNIYQYEDFRKFLSDAYEAMKRERGGLSQRDFATLAGITNPGFLNDVIKGRRKLSDQAVIKMSQALELKSNEADYFTLLVEYGQAKKQSEKDALWEKLLFRRNRSQFVRLHGGSSKYYQDWHYPLVRAAIEVHGFRGDYESLARFIRPALALPLVKKCVRELCEWGLLEATPEGNYRVTHRNQEPAPTLGDLIRRLNREWVQQAGEAVFTLPKEERHISSSLLTVSLRTRQEIQQRIESFREEIFALAKRDEKPEVVLQFSIQCLPRTQVKTKD
jgi:uncharacterized protein (TIGR02147 family)